MSEKSSEKILGTHELRNYFDNTLSANNTCCLVESIKLRKTATSEPWTAL